MIKIENGISDKVEKINSSNTINQYLNIKLIEENDLEKKATKNNNKKANNDIYQVIRKKASIINSDQRGIQDKISIIQAQEQKIKTIENTLKQARTEYTQAIQNGKKEEIKQKIKVRQINKQIDDLKNQAKEKDQKQEEVKYKDRNYIQDENKLLEKVNQILKKINSTKIKLEQYKSELISLSQDIQINKSKIDAQESEIRQCLDDSEYITNGIEINLTDYVDLRGNIATGIIINIYI